MHALRAGVTIAIAIVMVTACSDEPTTDPASSQPDTSTPAPASVGLSASAEASRPPALTSDPLHAIALLDVRTGEEFTLGQLAAEKPVLLEMMVIWCTNCRAQMHRVVEAHAHADYHSVGIDVDPREVADDLKTYVADQGFDWRFALANTELAGLLRDRFGDLVLNPPSMPMAILHPDGTIQQLEFGGYEVDELVAALGG
jgi:hypothetical protein